MTHIGIIGLGYVGLPMACLFAEKYRTVGYDMNSQRVEQLLACDDRKDMLTADELRRAFDSGLVLTDSSEQLRECNMYIVVVPTPIDSNNMPDCTCLVEASRLVGGLLKKGDTVVYESTVYPGCTEEVCLPVLEEVSGLTFNTDFFLGYSPERINPGDSKHTVAQIRKVTSGSTPEAAERIDKLYNSVLQGGTYRAASIKVAEASKIMENTQRDINIAIMNEMAVVMRALGVDVNEVIEAASTKWNFIRLQPGLVGGHCISVDPYYLIERARQAGVEPSLMATARRVNEGMAAHVAGRTVTLMRERGVTTAAAHVLLLGFTFKEDCPDCRNTKVADLYRCLVKEVGSVTVYDPNVDPADAQRAYGINIITSEAQLMAEGRFEAVVHAVQHKAFQALDLEQLLAPQGVLYDVKRISSKSEKLVTERL